MKSFSLFAAVLLSIALSAQVSASADKKGVLKDVDLENRTLTIINAAGEVEAVKFGPNLRMTHEGKSINVKRYLKPGLNVELKLTNAQASL